ARRSVRVERDPGEQRDLVQERPNATSGWKDLYPLAAVRADEPAHVFYQPKRGSASLLEHAQGFGRIQARYILWRGDQERAVQLQCTAQGRLRLARARGEVQKQIVGAAPISDLEQVTNQHTQDVGHRRHRLLLADKEANRHDAYAKAL